MILVLNKLPNKSTMKTENATTAALKAIDMELKALLQKDLENFKNTKLPAVSIPQAA